MANVGNWVSEITGTVGTGDILLAGGYQGQVSFAKAFVAGPVYYSVLDNGNRECGTATFNGTTGLARTTITATYENGVYNDVNPTPITLTGSAVVSCTYNASAFDDQVIDAIQANASAVAALASENAAAADLVLTNADVVLTHADVVITNADVVLTNADVTYADEWATKPEDVLVSVAAGANGTTEYSALHYAAKANLDAIQVAADLVQTNQDTIDTAADLIQTNQDTIDTAADVVITNANVVLTNADVVQTNTDVLTTASNAAVAVGAMSNYKGSWSSITAYVLGDTVTHTGELWLATTGSTNILPTEGNVEWFMVNGSKNLDGGVASSVYLPSQLTDGGTA